MSMDPYFYGVENLKKKKKESWQRDHCYLCFLRKQKENSVLWGFIFNLFFLWGNFLETISSLSWI